MDRLFNDMDVLVKHWAPFPRRFPSPFPLITADFVIRKDHGVRTTFNTCNFSLILRGRGEFWRAGRVWPVQAPCVLTQWPGEYVEYGPPIPGETWDELYLIYDARLMPRFKQTRLIDPQLPVWPMADLAAVHAQIAEFEALAHSTNPQEVVDRVDRVCERLILETRRERALEADGEPSIAHLIDELYFSRRFRTENQMAPSDYRRAYQLQRGGGG